MAERFRKKIILSALIAAMLGAATANAQEKYTNYKEIVAAEYAKHGPVGENEPGSVRPEVIREELGKGASLLLFDARVKDEYDAEHLPGAKLPRDDEYYKQSELFKQLVVREAPSSKIALERATKDLPRDTAIVTYCHAHCGLSKTLKLDLEDLGFKNVRWMDGGIDVWREKGYPLEKS